MHSRIESPGKSNGTKPRCLSVLLHAALFFGALSALTTIGAFVPGAIRARLWVGLPLGLALIALVAWSGWSLGMGVATCEGDTYSAR